jgi:hypothetical protein
LFSGQGFPEKKILRIECNFMDFDECFLLPFIYSMIFLFIQNITLQRRIFSILISWALVYGAKMIDCGGFRNFCFESTRSERSSEFDIPKR